MKNCVRHFVTLSLLVFFGSSVAFAGSGSIEGTVTYEGKVPTLKALKMDADPACMEKHATPPKSEALVLGDSNTMGNIFVSVKSGLAKKDYPAPTEAVVVDQKGCIYVPHVVGVMAGQPLKFLNSDGVLHNVHALPKTNRPFNLAMPGSVTESAPKQFKKVEETPFRIKCDVHPWMSTWVRVMSHPFFSVTQSDGKFKISGLPAGKYELEFWHEKLGAKTQSVEVADGEAKTVDYTFTR